MAPCLIAEPLLIKKPLCWACAAVLQIAANKTVPFDVTLVYIQTTVHDITVTGVTQK
jgi:hypothetical protein